jgi:hypothetical protein
MIRVVAPVLGDGDAGPLGDGDPGVLGTTPPVQATPFSVNAVGTGLLPVHEPLKPNEAVPLVASDPFQAALRTVTDDPDWVTEHHQPG